MPFPGTVPTPRRNHTHLGPKASLQLQTMPDMYEAMKRAEEGDTSKLPGPRDIVCAEARFRRGVLQDNWVEDEHEYTRNLLPANQHFRSVYGADYTVPNPPGKRDFEGFYEQFFHNEGVGHNVMFNHGGDAYENNHSTTYDVSFNHKARCDPNAKLKRYNRYTQNFKPQQDLAENFGDVTNYGLREYKHQLWDCEKKNEYLKLSEMKDKYRPMGIDDLVDIRVAVPKEFSSAIFDPNAKNRDVTFRGNRVSLVPNRNLIPQLPNLRCMMQLYRKTMAARRIRK